MATDRQPTFGLGRPAAGGGYLGLRLDPTDMWNNIAPDGGLADNSLEGQLTANGVTTGMTTALNNVGFYAGSQLRTAVGDGTSPGGDIVVVGVAVGDKILTVNGIPQDSGFDASTTTGNTPTVASQSDNFSAIHVPLDPSDFTITDEQVVQTTTQDTTDMLLVFTFARLTTTLDVSL